MNPIIPAWLDDKKLPASEFRVLAHLWRRRNPKTRDCFPSVESICEVCKLNEATVWTALRSLEAKGFIARRKLTRNRNQYDLFVLNSVTPNEGVTQSESATSNEGVAPTAKEAVTVTSKGAVTVTPNEGVRRRQVKETKEGDKGKGGHSPAYVPLSFYEPEEIRFCEEFRITREGFHHALTYFNAKRARYFFDDGQPSVDGFRVWLTEDQHARGIRARFPAATPAPQRIITKL